MIRYAHAFIFQIRHNQAKKADALRRRHDRREEVDAGLAKVSLAGGGGKQSPAAGDNLEVGVFDFERQTFAASSTSTPRIASKVVRLLHKGGFRPDRLADAVRTHRPLVHAARDPIIKSPCLSEDLDEKRQITGA